MNSYSIASLKRGWQRTANGPYGAPRGNPVMKAKRVSGPSANALMNERHRVDLAKERARLSAGMAKENRRKEIEAEMWWLRK